MERIEVMLVVAIATIAIFTEACVWIVRSFRALEYAKQKALDASLAQHELPLSLSDSFASAKTWIRPLHQRSIVRQNLYYDCLTRSVASLTLALFVLILSVTLLKDLYWFSAFSASVELMAFAYVLFQFAIGRRANREWVLARIETETVRQAAIVMATSVVANGGEIDDDNKQKWELVARNQTKILTNSHDLDSIVHEEWNKNSQSLSQYIVNINEKAFDVYISYRARRQMRWFSSSIARMQDNHERREKMLRVVFVACAILALVKLIVSFPQFQVTPLVKSWIAFALLSGAALSSAYTVFHISNNQRSLVHRYKTQVRQIEEWLRDCESLKAQVPFDAIAAQRQLMRFETMMENELLDWIRITLHDSLEITS